MNFLRKMLVDQSKVNPLKILIDSKLLTLNSNLGNSNSYITGDVSDSFFIFSLRPLSLWQTYHND